MQVMAAKGQGGAETFFVDMVSALQQAGLEQRVVIRTNPARAETLRQAGIAPVELRFRKWFDFRTRSALQREIVEFRPDVVHTWMNRASVIRLRGDFVRIGWLGGYYDLKNFRHCDHLVGVTQDIREHVVRHGWPRERAHYVPTLAHEPTEAALPRNSFDTPADAPLIVALGRLHVKKGFDVLLAALQQIPQAYLWLAGEGPLRAELEAQAHALNVAPRVRFLGWRTDRGALLRAADLCVMPSRYEPFGTVMIEAWACGTPLIAAAAAGPRALIRDGANGLLAPVDDIEALTQAIQRLLADGDLRSRLAAEAHREFRETFTAEAAVQRWTALYSEVSGR